MTLAKEVGQLFITSPRYQVVVRPPGGQNKAGARFTTKGMVVGVGYGYKNFHVSICTVSDFVYGAMYFYIFSCHTIPYN